MNMIFSYRLLVNNEKRSLEGVYKMVIIYGNTILINNELSYDCELKEIKVRQNIRVNPHWKEQGTFYNPLWTLMG